MRNCGVDYRDLPESVSNLEPAKRQEICIVYCFFVTVPWLNGSTEASAGATICIGN